MSTEILSIKLKKNGTAVVTYSEVVDPVNEGDESFLRNITYESDLTVHPDLFAAMQAFVSPMVIITEVVDEKKGYSDNEEAHEKIIKKLLLDYQVKGLHFSQRKRQDMFIVTGQKNLSTGKKMNLITPLTEVEDSDFPGANEISKLKELLCVEVEKYVFKGKHGGYTQAKLNLGDGPTITDDTQK